MSYSISEMQIGTNVLWSNEPCVVIGRDHTKLGRGGAILRLKMRGLVSGTVYETTLKGNDSLPEAEIKRSKAQFLYGDQEKLHFMKQDDFDQISLNKTIVGKQGDFLKEETEVDIISFDGKAINVQLPVKVDLKVTYAEPAVRGNTAQGNITKPVELETGVKIGAPLFIKNGYIVRVNTQTGQYVERASK